LERVTAAVPGRAYDVTIAADILDDAGSYLPELDGVERAFVVADANVADRYLEPLGRGLATRGWTRVHLVVPAGEDAKTLPTATVLYRQLASQEAHRDDLLVALGGGSVGDLAGFVAATYMRGVPFLQVPTTLTAQVDAAIGGKTAVNLPEGKNLVGAFHQPVAVLADVRTLATLPDREYRSGLAEVAKYALTIDLELLESLERDPAPVLERDVAALETLVARCVRAKAAVVGEDERDAGRRLILNYGHTLGHALERIEAFAGRSHGEAIAIGMTFAARIAEDVGTAVAGLAARHARLLSSLGLEANGGLPPADDVLAAMRMDKKYRGGMRFVLLEDVGRPVVVDSVPEDTLRRILEEMGARR
jgi:3-dehydroquinate synthase